MIKTLGRLRQIGRRNLTAMDPPIVSRRFLRFSRAFDDDAEPDVVAGYRRAAPANDRRPSPDPRGYMNEPPRTTILRSGEARSTTRRSSTSRALARVPGEFQVGVGDVGVGAELPEVADHVIDVLLGPVRRVLFTGAGSKLLAFGLSRRALAGRPGREILTPGEQELLLPRLGGPLPLRLGREEAADGASISPRQEITHGMRPDTSFGSG